MRRGLRPTIVSIRNRDPPTVPVVVLMSQNQVSQNQVSQNRMSQNRKMGSVMRKIGSMPALLLSLCALCLASPAQAIVVTATQNTNALVSALLGSGGSGVIVTGVSLSGHRQEIFESSGTFETSSGTFTNASGTYGIGPGVILSTGAVESYGDGPNLAEDWSTSFGIPATSAQEALLDPITTVGPDSYDHFDVTELIVYFDMQPGFDSARFNVVFGSEEFPEYVSDGYFDGFGMFLNGTNVAFVNALPVNITHPAMAALGGTELDGVLAPGGSPLLVFGGPVHPTGNSLRFIIGDREDPILDSTVYISSLRAVPEPAPVALALAALGTLCLVSRAHRGMRPHARGA